jgi:hypothetical protein
MARKKVSRALAPLPNRRGLEKAHHKTDALIEILRDVAVKNQQEQPRAFHSLRGVAAHFRVPTTTVSRAYRQLEQEGLISRVRGSKTILQGLHFDRQLSVRAFIGLPASLSKFVTIQDYRSFFIKIRRELRLRGFATAMAFFEKEETRTGALSKRLKAYEIDTVLWFQPPKEVKETALRLADLGIRLIGVAHDQVPVIPCRYQLRRERAIRELLTDWKAGAPASRVILAQWKDHRSPALEEILHTALDELGLKSTVMTFQGQRNEVFLRSLQKTDSTGIMFASPGLASRFGFRCPRGLTELLQQNRVAFLNGPVSMPFAKLPEVTVDLVAIDWQLVAERIVNDLITQDAFQLSGPTIFEAEAKLRVRLSDFSQAI